MENKVFHRSGSKYCNSAKTVGFENDQLERRVGLKRHSGSLISHLHIEEVIQNFKLILWKGQYVEDLTKPSNKFLYFVKPRCRIYSTISWFLKPYKSLPNQLSTNPRRFSYSSELSLNNDDMLPQKKRDKPRNPRKRIPVITPFLITIHEKLKSRYCKDVIYL